LGGGWDRGGEEGVGGRDHLFLPETNLRLTKETLYPTPDSSNSTPDSVVP